LSHSSHTLVPIRQVNSPARRHLNLS
jgi:hypothetical protein